MIDEIFEEYKKQEKENILLMTKHYGIDVKCLLYPNINNDLIVILDSVNLLNEEMDSFKQLDQFYEKIIKEGILLGIGFGKTHMIKKILEFPISKREMLDIDLKEYNEFFPPFDESKSDCEKIDEDGTERLIVSRNDEPSQLEVEISAVSYISKVIDNNHKELKKLLFEQFLDEFQIDRKKARFACNKRIKIDGENLKPLIKSRFFKEKTGKYKVKRIIEDYFEFMIDMGLEIGIRTGLRLVIEDIQNDALPYELLGNLSETETMMYIQKEHSEYIFKKYKTAVIA
ncbi:hypothetical protein [Methanobrevibacter sp.]|uniref:hypothetical protein n=1 Tax=Methanobrevibacter sp. TaxID=66852 RepID=UPI0025F6C3ED|nr:hypothetical protein [Methanobrevibacter sp.]MBQ2962335.1 hypothetical protein [Methanobrevibacter sp.]